MKAAINIQIRSAELNMTYTLDIIPFIKEVEKRPELWDADYVTHKFKHKKAEAWYAIAKVFIQEIDDMSDEEQKNVSRKLYMKWRNIRDTYVRHKKKYDSRPYRYAKYLTFVDRIYNFDQGEEESSDGDTKNNISTSYQENWQSDEESPSSSSNKRLKRKKKPKTIEYVDPDSLVTDIKDGYSYEDEDRSFFDSLLPAVRSLDMDQKLEFRSEILSLIRKIRSCEHLDIGVNPETGDLE